MQMVVVGRWRLETALVFFFSSPFISDNFQPKGTFTLHFWPILNKKGTHWQSLVYSQNFVWAPLQDFLDICHFLLAIFTLSTQAEKCLQKMWVIIFTKMQNCQFWGFLEWETTVYFWTFLLTFKNPIDRLNQKCTDSVQPSEISKCLFQPAGSFPWPFFGAIFLSEIQNECETNTI